jgi:hypothetical protein
MFTNILYAQDTGNAGVTSSLYLAQAQGAVTVIHEGNSQAVQPPQYLYEQDQIVTGPDAKAYLQFQNGGIVEVGPSSKTTVSTLEISGDDFKAKFFLAFGKLKAKVKKLTTASSTFEIYAGGVVAGVRGTIFGVDYDPAKKQVAAKTFEGSIFTQVGGKEKVVNKGMSMLVGKTGIPVLGALTSSDISSFQSFDSVSGLMEKKKDEILNSVKEKAKIHTGILPEKQENDLNDALRKKLPF